MTTTNGIVVTIPAELLDVSNVCLPETIRKRDGRIVAFDSSRIRKAIERCFQGIGRTPHTDIDELTYRVLNVISAKGVNTVEQAQDSVEVILMSAGEFEAAKAYVLYRAEHARLRAERPIPTEIQEAFAGAKQYFPTPLQEFQYFDKYARYSYETGRRETWPETVDRSVDFLKELVHTNVSEYVASNMSDTWTRIHQNILMMHSMPSMRLLAMAGPAARRNNLSIFNCSYVAIDSLESFSELLLISMAGCGVGFSVERKFVSTLPRIEYQRDVPKRTFVVEDTTEGWGDAVNFGLMEWFVGRDVEFDFSQIRPAGTPLKVKGGRASGSLPLQNALAFARERILARQGSHLRPLDAHDLACQFGNAAVSGGMRRTALISLFDPDDTEMANCKIGDFETHNIQRYNANNSAIIPEEGIAQTDFLSLWTAMLKSERGEPGIISRKAMKATIPLRRKWHKFMGGNPCFAPGTLIQTKNGHFPIESLVGQSVDIWNGSNWQTIDNFRITGTNQPILKIVLQDGSALSVTPYHQMILSSGERVQADELIPGDRLQITSSPNTHGSVHMLGAYAKGFLLAEGTLRNNLPALDLYGPKQCCFERLKASLEQVPIEAVRTNALVSVGMRSPEDPVRSNIQGLAVRQTELLPWVMNYREKLPDEAFAWDLDTKLEFLAGLFDGDGTVSDSDHGFAYQITSIHRELLLGVQALLKTIGVHSKLSQASDGGLREWPDGNVYVSQQSWRLSLSQTASVTLAKQVIFSRLVSFEHRPTKYQMKPRFNSVVSVKEDGFASTVYCCTVEGSHSLSITQGIQVGQCFEIYLRPYGLCNLSIAVARADDTFETLKEKVEIATIIGTIQSLATNFQGLRPQWKQNAEEERLLGVDITGQRDCRILEDAVVLQQLKQHAIDTNLIWAERFSINQSTAITCVKPSGNSSVLLDVASGLHPRWSAYYIRRVRVSAKSSIAAVLRDSGVPLIPEVGQDAHDPFTWVVEFPVKAPEGTMTRDDLTAIDQFDYWKHVKLNWTEHNPSVTVQYKPDEVIPLMNRVWENLDILGGMSFLPFSNVDLPLLPYEAITRKEYEERRANFPQIDWSKLYRYESVDMTTAAQEVACVANQCDV